jgi:hypothetical protein
VNAYPKSRASTTGVPLDYLLAMSRFEVSTKARALWALCLAEAYGHGYHRPYWVLLHTVTASPWVAKRIGTGEGNSKASRAMKELVEKGVVEVLREGRGSPPRRGAVCRLTHWKSWAWAPGKAESIADFVHVYTHPELRRDGPFRQRPMGEKPAQAMALLWWRFIPSDQLTPDHPTTSADDARWLETVLCFQRLVWRGYHPAQIECALRAAARDAYYRERIRQPDGAHVFYENVHTFLYRSRPMLSYTPEPGDLVYVSVGHAQRPGVVKGYDERVRRYEVLVTLTDGTERLYKRTGAFLVPREADDDTAPPVP